MSGLVTDALALLDHLAGQDLDEAAEHAVGLLALIAGQDVESADDSDSTDGRWRIARRTAPDRIISTVDAEARHIHKTQQQRDDGYKAHLAVEPETGLFTAVALRSGAGAAYHEAAVAPGLLAHERGQLHILADAAYATAELRAATGELAFPYCYRPAGQPATLARLIAAAGLRRPVKESFQAGKDLFGLDESQARLHEALLRHLVLIMAALAVCAVTAAAARHGTDTQTGHPTHPDQAPPADPA
ncbi:DDE family transposase [Nonomuraea fuscirosea]|uniref:DDE family transposase n=1 Tax=Nonomuraea fuscirosea TaxID=1291556 RepID=A0A2T0LT47_9ACTN|nr:DDE family transposase [Nonomuraea fuscirosea]